MIISLNHTDVIETVRERISLADTNALKAAETRVLSALLEGVYQDNSILSYEIENYKKKLQTCQDS